MLPIDGDSPHTAARQWRYEVIFTQKERGSMSGRGLVARCAVTVAVSLVLSGLASTALTGPASATSPAFGQQKTLVGAALTSPTGMAVDAAGDVFVAHPAGNQVTELTPAGIQSVLGIAGLSGPQGVAVDTSGDVFVADTDNSRVVELTPGGVQTTLGFAGLLQPQGLAVDASGDVFVADSINHRVVELTPAGVQTTLGFTDLSAPHGVAVDSAGNVYVVDTGNSRLVELPALQIASVFTSAASATFAAGSHGSFVATASGAPAPTFS